MSQHQKFLDPRPRRGQLRHHRVQSFCRSGQIDESERLIDAQETQCDQPGIGCRAKEDRDCGEIENPLSQRLGAADRQDVFPRDCVCAWYVLDSNNYYSSSRGRAGPLAGAGRPRPAARSGTNAPMRQPHETLSDRTRLSQAHTQLSQFPPHPELHRQRIKSRAEPGIVQRKVRQIPLDAGEK